MNRQVGGGRYAYNWALALATTTYQTPGPGITRFSQEKEGYLLFRSKRGQQSATHPQGVKIYGDTGVGYRPTAGWIRSYSAAAFRAP